MSKAFQMVMYVVAVDIVVMVVGEVWCMSAAGEYTSAETRYASAADDYDHDGQVVAMWDQYNAQTT